MSGPKHELRARIAAALAPDLSPEKVETAANALMRLFYSVDDEWDRIETTTMIDDGKTWIDQRWLVCRVPVQAQPYSRIANRNVEG